LKGGGPPEKDERVVDSFNRSQMLIYANFCIARPGLDSVKVLQLPRRNREIPHKVCLRYTRMKSVYRVRKSNTSVVLGMLKLQSGTVTGVATPGLFRPGQGQEPSSKITIINDRNRKVHETGSNFSSPLHSSGNREACRDVELRVGRLCRAVTDRMTHS
jgi:hypothetical protein